MYQRPSGDDIGSLVLGALIILFVLLVVFSFVLTVI